MYEFQLRLHGRLFLRVRLTLFQHWFRQWPGAGQATSHCLNKWWLAYGRIYASLGLNAFTHCYSRRYLRFDLHAHISCVLLECIRLVANVCTARQNQNGGLRGNQVLSRPITCRSPACRYACQNQRHYCEANESENWQEVIAFVTPKQQLTWYQEHGLCWIAFWYTCSILRDNDISIYLNMSVYGPTELKIAGIGLTVPPWHIHKFHRHVLVLVLIPLQLWNRTVNNGKYIY